MKRERKNKMKKKHHENNMIQKETIKNKTNKIQEKKNM